MIAFEVQRNGKPFCIASSNDMGFVIAMIRWVRGDADGPEVIDVEVCGQRDKEHVVWRDEPLKIGDEITIRVIDTAEGEWVSKPIHSETLP